MKNEIEVLDLVYGNSKVTTTVGSQWLKLVILATWEAGIRRIMVSGQPVQIVLKTLSSK
jgi:hypothetical protein